MFVESHCYFLHGLLTTLPPLGRSFYTDEDAATCPQDARPKPLSKQCVKMRSTDAMGSTKFGNVIDRGRQ